MIANENQKIIVKLPDWLTSRWNREVLEVEEKTNTFPSFSQFVKFLMKEPKIVYNPVTSLYALKSSDNGRTNMLKNQGPVAKVLATSSGENNSAVLSCVFCEIQGHGLHRCCKFLEKTVDE